MPSTTFVHFHYDVRVSVLVSHVYENLIWKYKHRMTEQSERM
jgi:hypothetical protein